MYDYNSLTHKMCTLIFMANKNAELFFHEHETPTPTIYPLT